MRRISLAAVLVALVGCGIPAGHTTTSIEPVVYGTDDRQDYYAHPDQAWRDRAFGSSVALLDISDVNTSNPQNVQISGQTLGSQGLCSNQRFLNQTSAAFCSGVLIDDDLVLTAGHCVTSTNECQGTRFVFRFLMTDENTLGTITTDDVFSCQRIAVRRTTSSGVDYGIIQLDRAATPRHLPAPVSAARTALAVGDSVTMIGFPDGIPMKIDSGGKVLDAQASTLEYFAVTTDSFGANSGSPLFDTAGTVVGILVRGENDYNNSGGCYVVNVLPENGSQGNEDATYAFNAIAALCEANWPSARLCQSTASCGDGTCTVNETHATCPQDCPAPVCGDGRCDPGESGTCEADCGGQPPTEWSCDPGYYGTQDGCDCECGALDPDCTDPTQELYGCRRNQVCGPQGTCVAAGTVDAGTPPADAGTPPADAGTPPADAGTPPADAGTPTADAGTPPTDAGLGADGGITPAPPGGGCSSAGGAAGASGWLWLGLLAFGWRRRRRP